MQLFKKLTTFFSLKEHNNVDEETRSKIVIYSILTFFAILFFLLFSIFEFIKSDFKIGGAFLGVSIILAFLLMLSRQPKKFKISRTLSLGVLYALFLYFGILYNSKYHYLTIIILFLPVYSIFVTNQKKGRIISLTFLAVLGIVYFLFKSNDITGKNLHFIFSFTLLYVGVILGAAYFEYFRQKAIYKYEIELLKTQKLITEKNDFIESFSYKVRTPLSSLLGILEISKEMDRTTDIEVLSTIEASVNNLITVVNNFASASAEKLRYVKHHNLIFSIRNTLDKLTFLLESNIGKNKKFQVNISENVPSKIYGNAVLTKQILLAALELFCENTAEGGIIYLSIKKEKAIEKKEFSISFVVKSNITKENLVSILGNKHAIEDLKKASSEEALNVINLLQTMKGSYVSSFDEGIFSFEFKLFFKEYKENKTDITQLPEIKNETETAPNFTENPGADINGANVLLVEDNKLNQKIILLSLNKYVKNIDVAENGKQALGFFGKTRYDVILMDIQMPVMDGYKTTEKIRETEKGTETRTPIIAITANALSGDRQKCLNAGMDDYISKPFQINSVVTRIKHYLNKAN